MKNLEKRKKAILRKVLTKDALEKLSRVKISRPIIASQLEMYFVQVYEAGQLNDEIDDKKLKEILNTLAPKNKTKIKRK